MKDARIGRRILIIAGPNGAGKTTFAREYLPNEGGYSIFINADLIAQGLSPLNPDASAIRAGSLMLEMIDECVRKGESFALETALSGLGLSKLIPKWKVAGYTVTLIFLKLPSPEESSERVRRRVIQGGHNVPEETIRRRFDSGWKNFHSVYRQLVDFWKVYDNSGPSAVKIEEGANE